MTTFTIGHFTSDLRILCDNAIPGPWTFDNAKGFTYIFQVTENGRKAIAKLPMDKSLTPQFIAASRTAIPMLLEDLKRCREENSELSRKVWEYEGKLGLRVEHKLQPHFRPKEGAGNETLN